MVENGALVGLVETVAEGDELLIVNVAVHHDGQGEGHGVRLLRHAEALAREDKLKGPRVYPNRLMSTKSDIYARLGYVREKETGSKRVHDSVIAHIQNHGTNAHPASR